jgi:hypothetical protein
VFLTTPPKTDQILEQFLGLEDLALITQYRAGYADLRKIRGR